MNLTSYDVILYGATLIDAGAKFAQHLLLLARS